VSLLLRNLNCAVNEEARTGKIYIITFTRSSEDTHMIWWYEELVCVNMELNVIDL
jgi:hypothetical protein